MWQKRALVIGLLVGLLSLGLFLYTYDDCRPEASLEVRINQKEAVKRADAFMRAQGFDARGYKQAVTMEFQDQFYLKKTFGMKETTRLIRSVGIPCWSWQVRYYKISEKEGFSVFLNPTTGEIIYFGHALMDDAAAAAISHDQAKSLAESILHSLNTYGDYELVTDSTEELKNRNEHIFEWKVKNLPLADAALRVYVSISGDKLGYYSRYLKVPDAFFRAYARESTPSWVVYFIFWVLNIFLNIAMLVVLFIQYKNNRIRWRFAGGVAAVFLIFSLIEIWNIFPVTRAGYNTVFTKNMYLVMRLCTNVGKALIVGVGVFLMCAVGDSLSGEIGIEAFPVIRLLKERKFSSPVVRERIVFGYTLGLLRLGYVTVFYLVAVRFVSAWKILPNMYAQSFNIYLPFLLPVTMAVTDAFLGELKFRLFTVSLFKKYFKLTWVAVMISSLFWVFNDYSPAIFPTYLKVIELATLGVVWGLAYMRYGVETVAWAEAVFTFVLAAIPLLKSTDTFFHTAGIIAVAILLLPAALLFMPLAEAHPQSVERKGAAI